MLVEHMRMGLRTAVPLDNPWNRNLYPNLHPCFNCASSWPLCLLWDSDGLTNLFASHFDVSKTSYSHCRVTVIRM